MRLTNENINMLVTIGDQSTKQLILDADDESKQDLNKLETMEKEPRAANGNEAVENQVEFGRSEDIVEIQADEVEEGKTTPPGMERIDTAITTLKSQLMEMQRQDVYLLRQLMQIHATISVLNGSRDPHRRSESSSSMHGSLDSPGIPGHRPLRRENSEPMRPRLQRSSTAEEPPVTEEDPDLDDGGPLCHSFNSFSTLSDSANWLSTVESPIPLSPLSPNVVDSTLPFVYRPKRCSTIAEEIEIGSDGKSKRVSDCSANSSVFPDDEAFDDQLDPGPGPALADSRTNGRIVEYEVHYETLLKRSVQLWKEIQTEKEETGTVDKRKIAALKLFL